MSHPLCSCLAILVRGQTLLLVVEFLPPPMINGAFGDSNTHAVLKLEDVTNCRFIG